MAHGLAEWVFVQIRIHFTLWQSVDLKVLPIGVKFSLRPFTPDQLVKMISTAIIRGVKAKMLCLELSGIAGSSDARGGAMTTKLRDWGFRIALDGCCCGTGGIGLADLEFLSIDEIKCIPGLCPGLKTDPRTPQSSDLPLDWLVILIVRWWFKAFRQLSNLRFSRKSMQIYVRECFSVILFPTETLPPNGLLVHCIPDIF